MGLQSFLLLGYCLLFLRKKLKDNVRCKPETPRTFTARLPEVLPEDTEI